MGGRGGRGKLYIHTVEYYWATKRNELPMHKAMRINLKCIMLNEQSQAQKITWSLIAFQWCSRKHTHIGTVNSAFQFGNRGKEVTFMSDEMFCILIVMLITWWYFCQNSQKSTPKTGTFFSTISQPNYNKRGNKKITLTVYFKNLPLSVTIFHNHPHYHLVQILFL